MLKYKNEKKLEEGDIFYVLYSGKYIFARILLDVSKRILQKEPEHKSKFFQVVI